MLCLFRICSCFRAVGPALEQAGNQVLSFVDTEFIHCAISILINMQSAYSKRHYNTCIDKKCLDCILQYLILQRLEFTYRRFIDIVTLRRWFKFLIVTLDLNVYGEERLVLVTEHRIKYNVVMNKWLGGQIFATRSRLLCFRALKALSWTSGC